MLKKEVYRKNSLAFDRLTPLLDEGFDDQEMWTQNLDHLPRHHTPVFSCTKQDSVF